MDHLPLDKLCQIELMVSNAKESLDFYQKVFGWQQVPIEIHNYHVLETGEDNPYGVSITQSTKRPSSNHIVLHFATDNPDPILARAEAFTGVPPAERKVPGYGTVWIIKDPDGQKFGVFKKKVVKVKRGP